MISFMSQLQSIDSLLIFILQDMEDLEYKTQTKQRQHFEEQFTSKVKLTYSDKKEDVQEYKSRYNAQSNPDTTFALRMANYHNSQVF